MSEMSDKSLNEMPEPQPVEPARRPGRRPSPGVLFPMILIFVGVMLLLRTTGALDFSLWNLFSLWPALLVLIGLDILLRYSPVALKLLLALVIVGVLVGVGVYLVLGGPEVARVSLERSWPLQEADRGAVTLNIGVGHLAVEALESGTNFAEAALQGWPADREPQYRQDGNVARLEISQEGSAWVWPASWGREPRWLVALTPRVPLELDIDGGVGETELRLGSLDVQDLRVDLGIGKIAGTLPGAGGPGKVRIHAGIGAVEVRVPAGVEAQISADPGLGGVSVDESRFPQRGDEELYRSPGCVVGSNCLEIEIDVGIGSIQVR